MYTDAYLFLQNIFNEEIEQYKYTWLYINHMQNQYLT